MALPSELAQVSTPARHGCNMRREDDQGTGGTQKGNELMAALCKQRRRVDADGIQYVKQRDSAEVGYAIRASPARVTPGEAGEVSADQEGSLQLSGDDTVKESSFSLQFTPKQARRKNPASKIVIPKKKKEDGCSSHSTPRQASEGRSSVASSISSNSTEARVDTSVFSGQQVLGCNTVENTRTMLSDVSDSRGNQKADGCSLHSTPTQTSEGRPSVASSIGSNNIDVQANTTMSSGHHVPEGHAGANARSTLSDDQDPSRNHRADGCSLHSTPMQTHEGRPSVASSIGSISTEGQVNTSTTSEQQLLKGTAVANARTTRSDVANSYGSHKEDGGSMYFSPMQASQGRSSVASSIISNSTEARANAPMSSEQQMLEGNVVPNYRTAWSAPDGSSGNQKGDGCSLNFTPTKTSNGRPTMATSIGSDSTDARANTSMSSSQFMPDNGNILDIPDDQLLSAISLLSKIAEAKNLTSQLSEIERGRSSTRDGIARSASPVSKLFSSPPGSREQTPQARSVPAALDDDKPQRKKRRSRVRFDPNVVFDKKQEEREDEEEKAAARVAAAAAARAGARRRRFSRGPDGSTIEAPRATHSDSDENDDASTISRDQPALHFAKGLKGMAYGAARGAMYGAVPAVFTFGLSIPVCATANALRHGYRGLTESESAPESPRPAS